MKSISNKRNSQLQYLTTANRYFGLSDSGSDLLAQFGASTSARTAYTFTETKKLEYKENLETILDNSNVVPWIDNWCKYYRLSNPRGDGTPFSNCLFTAVGFRRVISNLSMKLTPGKKAVPSNIFGGETQQFFKDLFSRYNLSSVLGWSENSTCNACGIYCVPLSPSRRYQGFSQFISLKEFFPYRILDHNIGSNDGFASVLKFIKENFLNRGKYIVIKADINIFWRYYKFVLNPGTLMPDFKQKLAFFLGPWHNYKEASELLWKKYLSQIFAPGLHFLFPEKKVLKEPKLGHIETYLTWFLLAYQEVVPDIQLLRADLDGGDSQLGIFINLLSEVFDGILPLVWTSYILKKKNITIIFFLIYPRSEII